MIDKREAEKLKKAEAKNIVEGKASIRAYSKMNAKATVVRRARSIKDVDVNYLTSKLSLNDIRDLRKTYKSIKDSNKDNWEAVSLEILSDTGMTLESLDNFIEDSSPGSKKRGPNDVTLRKLRDRITSLSLYLVNDFKQDKELENRGILYNFLTTEKVWFTDAYLDNETESSIFENLAKSHKEIKGLRKEIFLERKFLQENKYEQGEREIANLRFLQQMHDKCNKLIKSFKEKNILIYAANVPSYKLASESSASFILLSAIPLEAIKKTNNIGKGSRSDPENLPFTIEPKDWNKIDYQSVENIIEGEEKNLKKNVDFVSIQNASKYLKKGGVLIIPTEAIYGFAADPFSEAAALEVKRIKQREKNDFILVSGDMSHLDPFFEELEYKYVKKAQEKWPGFHTWVLPANEKCPPWLVNQTTKTIALRLSDHPLIKKLTEEFGQAIISTSANISGKEESDSKDFKKVYENFSKEVMFIEGNLGGKSRSSPVVNLITDEVYRK